MEKKKSYETQGAPKRTYDVDKDGRISWNELDIKDKIAYVMAVILILSGIAMAFTAFFVHPEHEITSGPLMYCSEAFITGGGLLGIGLYVKNKFTEMTSYIHKKLDRDDQGS